MYKIFRTKDFEKSLKKIEQSGKFKNKTRENLQEAIIILSVGKNLPKEYKDHRLLGELKKYRECHIKGDLLLVYKIEKYELILVLVDIGTHSYLNL